MKEENIPKEIKDFYNKASISIEKKNYGYAIELLRHTIEVKPEFTKGRKLLRLVELKNFEENTPNAQALFIIRALSFAHMLFGMINEIKGDRRKAISVYEDILTKDPKNTAVLIKLGNLLKTEGMKEEAIVTLESALNISVKHVIAYQLLGELLLDIGDYDRASSCFKSALELKPGDTRSQRGLKNVDALTTIDKSFKEQEEKKFNIREIRE